MPPPLGSSKFFPCYLHWAEVLLQYIILWVVRVNQNKVTPSVLGCFPVKTIYNFKFIVCVYRVRPMVQLVIVVYCINITVPVSVWQTPPTYFFVMYALSVVPKPKKPNELVSLVKCTTNRRPLYGVVVVVYNNQFHSISS